MHTIAELTNNLPQLGSVQWLGLRPARRAAIDVITEIEVSPGAGIIGDRYNSSRGKRQVTLVQSEHLSAIASMLGMAALQPETLRRNLVIKGINLLALKGHRFQVGDAVLEYTGLCHPCSRMEEVLGSGGYNAVRGHGGITASVIKAGRICVGDTVGLIE